MTNDVYREMIKMETFNDRQRELLDRKKKLVSDLNQYKDVENVIKASRNKVYAHNDLNYHWFKDAYVEKWGMTEQIYDDILTITNICIDYCNGILKLFNQRLIYEYSIAIQEISKGCQRQKTNQHSRMDESERKPEQYHAGVGVII